MRGDSDQPRADEARITPAPTPRSKGRSQVDAAVRLAADDVPRIPATKDPGGDGPASASSPGLRVLVVDDDPDAREMLTVLLEACGMIVRSAPSARAALDLVSGEPPDVIVSDIGMPEEDGYSLIRKVRELPGEVQGVPAIALTAFARNEDRQRALRAGFDRHLAKPVEPAQLTDIIVELARARAASRR